MDRDVAYLTALLAMAVSVLLTGWSSIDLAAPSLPPVLMIVGGMGLFVASAYSLYASESTAPQNDGIFRIVILGAVLTVLGLVIQFLGV